MKDYLEAAKSELTFDWQPGMEPPNLPRAQACALIDLAESARRIADALEAQRSDRHCLAASDYGSSARCLLSPGHRGSHADGTGRTWRMVQRPTAAPETGPGAPNAPEPSPTPTPSPERPAEGRSAR